MNCSRRMATKAVIGGWVLSALFSQALAETPTASTMSQVSPGRSAWEQRVLGRGQPRHASAGQTVASNLFARSWGPRGQSYYLAPTGAISPAVQAGQIVEEGGPVLEETEMFPGEPFDPMPMEGVGCGHEPCGAPGAGCGPDCGGCGQCFGQGGCFAGPQGCWPGWWLRNFSLFAGVHGFKGPLDFGANGNFGVHEGLNFGGPLGGPCGIGYQVGFQAVHSNFSGPDAGPGSGRDQTFFTAGIFRRAVCGGLQWGVVFDLLHDSYFASTELKQIRAELALVRAGCREIGFWGAFGVGDDALTDQLALEPTDLFAFFYRRHFSGGGQGRVWTGVTGQGDALLGADCTIPLGTSWALENNFSYLIPKEGSRAGGWQQESWSVMIQLVWYPGRPASCVLKNPYHPLLNVADNSVFMADFQQP